MFFGSPRDRIKFLKKLFFIERFFERQKVREMKTEIFGILCIQAWIFKGWKDHVLLSSSSGAAVEQGHHDQEVVGSDPGKSLTIFSGMCP